VRPSGSEPDALPLSYEDILGSFSLLPNEAGRIRKWTHSDSNREPSPCKGVALPIGATGPGGRGRQRSTALPVMSHRGQPAGIAPRTCSSSSAKNGWSSQNGAFRVSQVSPLGSSWPYVAGGGLEPPRGAVWKRCSAAELTSHVQLDRRGGRDRGNGYPFAGPEVAAPSCPTAVDQVLGCCLTRSSAPPRPSDPGGS
jgi:hypothetical protein